LTVSLSDPAPESGLLVAAQWLQGTLLGSVATAVAVIAFASIGYGMLSGRINLRRGATVVIGCFVLFGAPAIAAGLRELSFATLDPGEPPAPIAVPPPPPRPPAAPYDPYAGAAVPAE